MASLNRASIIGNVGKDPEIKTLQNGSKVANLSIATSEKWKDKSSGETRERTEWHRIVVWNDGLIGVIERYIKKGSKLMIEGQIQTRKYEKDGVDHYTTEIVLQGFGGSLIMLGDPGGSSDRSSSQGGGGRDAGNGGSYGSRDSGTFSADLDDEIPF